MSETIVAGGTTYTGVEGFKATDGQSNTKTFIIPSGTKSITENGTGIDVSSFAAVDVAVSGGIISDEVYKKIIEETDLQRPLTLDYITKTASYAFYGIKCDWLYLPNLTNPGKYMVAGATCQSLVVPKVAVTNQLGRNVGTTGVQIVDLNGTLTEIDSYAFNSAVFHTLILRPTSLLTLKGINAFQNTKYGSGGTGGTIYIPKVLYDHLGDGSAYDYKSATNWATIDGYGNTTWAKIEGSQYENYYANGVQIPTS